MPSAILRKSTGAHPAPADLATIEPRIANPAMLMPDALAGIQKLLVAVQKGGVPASTLALTHMRASQINGCSACVALGIRHAKQSGETVERLLAVSAWRDSSQFTHAERAALELTEAATRLADRSDPVPDEVWNLAAEYYDETALAALVLHVGLTNLFNRLNVSARQQPGEW